MVFHKAVFVLLVLIFCSVKTEVIHAEETSRTFSVTNGTVKVHFIDPFTRSEQKKIMYWLAQNAAAVTTLYGKFPIDDAVVTVKKAQGASEPVPWGQVLRERIEGVNFHVNPRFSRADFMRDWTAAHEFSHLFIPFPGNKDSWFSEGLATYLQNTLRVRASMLSEQQGWQKLYEGLRRGQRDTKMQDMPLAELSPKMWDSRSYQRVYWSGVCYFLRAEIDLFDATGGEHSLDSVLRDFNRCCRFKKKAWSALALAQRFDQISGTKVFTRNLRDILKTYTLPEIEPLFAELGLRVNRRRIAVVADNNVLRQRIMRGALSPVVAK
ncbi:MAG: hypothetical protein ACR2P1_06100 [Pseudomonadales bacterium]